MGRKTCPSYCSNSSCDSACNVGDKIEYPKENLVQPNEAIDCYVERLSGDREQFAIHSVEPITGKGTDQERENQ